MRSGTTIQLRNCDRSRHAARYGNTIVYSGAAVDPRTDIGSVPPRLGHRHVDDVLSGDGEWPFTAIADTVAPIELNRTTQKRSLESLDQHRFPASGKGAA